MHEATLDIRLLGPLQVGIEGSDAPLTLPRSRKARALLGYLATTGRAHSRSHLCDLLWEGPNDPRAALRWSLSRLRSSLEGDSVIRIVSEGDQVRLDQARVRLDVDEARTTLAASAPEARPEALESALKLFRGPFMDGLDPRGCFRFEQWCAAERRAMHELHASILERLTGVEGADPTERLGHAREWVVLEPLREDAHIRLIQILARRGAVSEALEQYERCRRVLKRELGTQPSDALESVRASLLPRVRRNAAGASGISPLRRELLAGRRDELSLLEAWLATPSAPDVLLLAGEAGIGKSRLLEEVVSLVRAKGAEALAASAFEAERSRPYGIWIDLLRSITTEEIPADLRSELAPLLPELGPGSVHDGGRSRLHESLVNLLLARRSRGPAALPLVLVLDDMHWADAASIALLHYLVRHSLAPGLRVACAVRPHDLQQNEPARAMFHDLGRSGYLRSVKVLPLEREAVIELTGRIAESVDGAAVHEESGGNPLFALELARARAEGRHDLPPTIDALIADRLARLDPDAAELIPWLSAMGRACSPQMLAQITELTWMDLQGRLEHLEQRGVLRPNDGDYSFAHELIRRAAYQRLSAPRRRLIHGRIARFLAEEALTMESTAADVAHHAALAGDDELAAAAWGRAAARCLAMFAYSEAAAMLVRGLEHADRVGQERRLILRLRLLELYVDAGMEPHRPAGLLENVRQAIEEARETGAAEAEATGRYLVSVIHYQSGHFGYALESTLGAEVAGRAAEPRVTVRSIAETARCLGLLERDMPRARRLAREAQSLVDRLHMPDTFHQIPMAFGLLHHHEGALDAAVACFDRAARLARRAGERWWENACLRRVVMIELERGRPEAALAGCDCLTEVAFQLGEGSDAPFAAALRALAELQLEQEHAAQHLEQALEELRLADSQWMIAYAQNSAALIELDRGRVTAARRRAEQALEAATVAGRPSAIAIATRVLRRTADAPGGRASAAAALHGTNANTLSARARSVLQTPIRKAPEIHT